MFVGYFYALFLPQPYYSLVLTTLCSHALSLVVPKLLFYYKVLLTVVYAKSAVPSHSFCMNSDFLYDSMIFTIFFVTTVQNFGTVKFWF